MGRSPARQKRQKGAVLVIVALLIVVFVAFAALSIDIGHLYVVRNELQNGADAGALAGARVLYLESDATQVNVGANEVANAAAVSNLSEKLPVEVGVEDVQRGHWSFTTQTFTANDSMQAPELWDASTQELDLDPNFVNAVRVVARRETIPAASFFAQAIGYGGLPMRAEAVAYLGFAGTLHPLDVDQPIAICDAAINTDGVYTCNVGRMISSGQGSSTPINTGAWTDFNQDNPCSGGTNSNAIKGLVCDEGNPGALLMGEDMALTNGQVDVAFQQLDQCWRQATNRTEPWNMTLPVIECGGDNDLHVTTCAPLISAVNVNVLWINRQNDPKYNNVPNQMAGFNDYTDWDPPSSVQGLARWTDFTTHFNLQDMDGNPAPYLTKTIYFAPDCSPHAPAGNTAGRNFGVMAKIPVLVQ
ncbi:pilus assembly protein TadG-related protein [Myxococcota bacterium]